METNQTKQKAKKHMNPWLRLGIKIGVIAVLVVILLQFFGFHSIHDNSMFPSIRDGSLVVTANFLPYSFNDVVAYMVHTNGEKNEIHFGRIMCLEGNELQIEDTGYVFVNGSQVETSRFYEGYDIGTIGYPYKVEEESYFILQDYRIGSGDSRVFGAIPKEDILGKVIFNFQIRNF